MYNYCWCPTYTQLPMSPLINNDRFALREFWKKYLMERAMSVYDWTMPELWSENYFKYLLYGIGYVSVLYTVKYGWVPQRCTLAGYSLFEEPDRIVINNQFIGGIDRQIGEACVLFKFNPDFSGVSDVIEWYAMQLAEMSLTIQANLQNTKVSYVMTSSDKVEGDKMGKVMDQILNGEPAVIVKKLTNNKWDNFTQNVKQNYVVSDLLVDMRKLLNMFNTEFGIPNSNTEKKERLVTDEVNSNNVETKSRAEMWLESFKETCKELNSMAGYEIMSVDWSKALKEGENDVSANSEKSEQRVSDSGRSV